MQLVLQVIVALLGLGAFVSFVGGFAANMMLIPYLDARAVRSKTARDVLWQFGNAAVPIECYKEDGHSLWRMRDRCLKSFAICAGLLAIVMVVAAIADVRLEFPK